MQTCQIITCWGMAVAFAQSNEVKSLLCTRNMYSVSSVCKVEFGFGFDSVVQKNRLLEKHNWVLTFQI